MAGKAWRRHGAGAGAGGQPVTLHWQSRNTEEEEEVEQGLLSRLTPTDRLTPAQSPFIKVPQSSPNSSTSWGPKCDCIHLGGGHFSFSHHIVLPIKDGQFLTVPCHCLADELMPSWAGLSGGKRSWFSLDSQLPESLFWALGSRPSAMSQQKLGTMPGRHRTSCPLLKTD